MQVVTKKKKCGHQRTIDLQVLCQNDLGVQIVKELFMCGAKLQKLGVVLALVRPYSPPSSKQSMSPFVCANPKQYEPFWQRTTSKLWFKAVDEALGALCSKIQVLFLCLDYGGVVA